MIYYKYSLNLIELIVDDNIEIKKLVMLTLLIRASLTADYFHRDMIAKFLFYFTHFIIHLN